MREALFIVRRYGPATIFTTIALILTLVLSPFHDRFPYVLLAGAVIASALQGGFKPGLFATGLATAAMTLRFLFFPATEATVTVGTFASQMGLAIFVGVLASYVGEHCWRAVRATEWLQTALGSAGEAVIFTDGDGKITFMNGVAQELTGWGQEIVGEKHLDAIFRIVDADTRLGLPSPLQRAVEGRTPTQIPDPTMLLSRADKERPIMGCLTPILNRDGEVQGSVLVFRDLSLTRKAAEERQRHAERCQAIVASLPVGVLMMDQQGRCIEANRAGAGICGTTQEESLGEGWVRFVHPQEREDLVVAWHDAIRKGAEFSREVQFATAQGRKVIMLRAAPVNTEKGIHLGHVGTLEDVKEFKAREEALTQAHENACRQSAEQKKQLDEAAARLAAEEQQGKERSRLAQQVQEREAELKSLRAELEAARKNYEDHLRQHGQKLAETRTALNEAEAAFRKKLQDQTAELGKKLQDQTAELSAGRAALQKRLDEAQEREKKAQKQVDEVRKKAQDEYAAKLAEATQTRDRLRQELDQAVERELHAEEALAREGRLWKRVLDNLDQGVAVWDSRGLLACLNRAGRACLGFEDGMPAPDNWANHVKFLAADGTTQLPPRDVPLLTPKREPFRNQELIVVPASGQRRTVSVSGRLLVDEDGQHLGATVSFAEAQAPKTVITQDESRLKPLQERLAFLESENERVTKLHAQAVQAHEVQVKPLQERLAHAETENERLSRLHAQGQHSHDVHVKPLQERLALIESENERLTRLHAQALQAHEVQVRPLRERLALVEAENERITRLHAQALTTHEVHVKPLRERLALVEVENERLTRMHAQALQSHDAHVRPLRERLAYLESENERLGRLHTQSIQIHETHLKPLQDRLLHVESENARLSRLHAEAVSAHELHVRPLRERLAQLEADNERLRRAHADAIARQEEQEAFLRERGEWQERTAAAEGRLREMAQSLERQRQIETRLQQELRDARQAADQHYRTGMFSRSLASSVGTALIAVDRHGSVLFVNAAAENLLGWLESEVRGRNIRSWLLFPSTDDRKPGLERAGQVVRENEVFARRDGGSLRVHCAESPLFVDGRAEGTIIAFHVRPDRPVAPESWRGSISEPHFTAHSGEVVLASASRPVRGQLLHNEEWIDYN
jgi:PAS domain S-box-containing protein